MSVSYSAFRTAIRQAIWPFPGEAKSLRPAHDIAFLEAMIQIQHWVPELRVNHTSVWPACSTYVQCGLTVVEAPIGVVKRVYTIANGEDCDKVYISSRSHMEVLKWQRCLMSQFTSPENAGMPALQQGFRFAEVSTDSTAGRARTGIWSINRKRFHLAPWLQSNESLVIEWDGEKKVWADTDVLDENYFDAEAAAVVKLYVQKAHERDFGCDLQKKKQLEIDYGQQLGDLIHAWKLRTENQENTDAEELNVCSPTSDDLADDAPLVVGDSETVGLIADFGASDTTLASQAETDVAAMVSGWAPDYVVTAGDNWYGLTQTELTKASLDAAVGQHYAEFIYPYLGSYGSGGDKTNNFYPTIGNHDRDPAGRLALELNYFNLAKPYYDFIRGHVHWFIVDSGYKNDKVTVDEADGNTAASVQGESFRLKMALSTARWKVVVMHHPPYSSVDKGAGVLEDYPAMRWPLALWGADLVLNGHSHVYERLAPPEGYPLISVGFAGKDLNSFAPVVSPYSLFRYAADFGAVRMTVSCDELKLEAFQRTGTLLDTLTLTKA